MWTKEYAYGANAVLADCMVKLPFEIHIIGRGEGQLF